MKSSLHPVKSSLRVNPIFLTLAAVAFLHTLSTQTAAQVYQRRPDGTLQYVPYSNPNIRRLPSRRSVPPIYPGQIINGERVTGALPSVTPRSQPSQPLARPEEVNPPQPPASKPSETSATKPSQDTRRDKVPATVFPIPAEASNEAPSAKNDSALIETPTNPQSSVAAEENLGTELFPDIVTSNSEPPEVAGEVLQEEKMEAPIDNEPLLAPMAVEEEAVPVEEKMPAIEEDMMAEIKEIRDQLGGGISETLEGVGEFPDFGGIEISPADESQTPSDSSTNQEISPDEMFNQQLRSVISEYEDSPATDRIVPNLQQSPVQQSPEATQELRKCAAELEQLAGRLEAIEAYQSADNLRRQASELWTKARSR